MKKNTLITLALALGMLLSFVAGVAWAEQTHMQNAKAALQNARAELQAAEDNKGGHRARAIDLVNQALGEVQAGIDYAR